MRRLGWAARPLAAPVTVLVLVALNLIGCGAGSSSAAPSVIVRPIVVTFELPDGDQRFKVLLTDPADIDIAAHLLQGDDVPSIPNGRIVRETGVNSGYHWSLDPNDFEFAAVTTEVCDGVPADVENGSITSDRYCPWSAVVVAIDPAP